MSAYTFGQELEEKYGLTAYEVTDIMRYMKILCQGFVRLAKLYKTEYLVELKASSGQVQNFKQEKSFFKKASSLVKSRVSSSANLLKTQYKTTLKARSMLVESLDAHKIPGDHKRTITEILELMAANDQLSDKDETITGRRAFEAMSEANIG
ncbi:MAG: hypothetical protein COA84_10935 [Robiginitomaculum sp.]|nr:MAG: hypothetical protein COA84_10935 [Robiginitomaculum sp.]